MLGTFLRRSFKGLDGRICVSAIVREYISRYFPGEYVIIPNGIDCARFNPAHVKPIERFDDGRPNILFMGRMEDRKGFRHLMRAFPLIKQAIPDARLIIAGAFTDRQKAPFVRYARTHKLKGMHFIGYVEPAELPRYYRTATVFCAPSTGFESFGIVLLEAMAAGVPIVASNIAGYCTVLDDGIQGTLVPPGDAHAIARAIVDLLRDPARRARMSQAGLRTAAQYDWDLIAQRVLDFYQQLIAQRAPLRPREPRGRKQLARVRKWMDSRGARNAAGIGNP